ncbi:MAG: hypothetical protein WCF57_09610 [Pyrinomonadaceae bacterium]
MSQDQPIPLIDEQSRPACCLCGILKQRMYGDACAGCVEATLLKYLPHLKHTLEDKYGAVLDQWFAHGHFIQANWNAGIDLFVCRERLKGLVREIVRDAIGLGEIALNLAFDQSWKPIRNYQLLEFVQEQCEEDIMGLLGALFLAIETAPTAEAERELIEVVSGKKRVNKWYVREEAISALVLTKGTPLSLPIKALIELRYRSDGGRSAYAKVEDGQISSVWKEIDEFLPTEVARLICANRSFESLTAKSR